MEMITAAEETQEAEEDRMTEEEAEKEIDQTEMEEVEVEEMMEKEDRAMSLERMVSASSEIGADSAMQVVEEEVMEGTDHLVGKAEATVEEEEMEAEEEAVEVAALEASQLIPALRQVSQCHLKLII